MSKTLLAECACFLTSLGTDLFARPNLEKLFYRSLIKFRDSHYDKYHGRGMEYSSSDHHHMARPPTTIAERRLQPRGSESQSCGPVAISVPSRQSSKSSDGPKSARTIASYDPYRSSQTPIPNPQASYARVVIHRPSSNSSDEANDNANDGSATQQHLDPIYESHPAPSPAETAQFCGSFRRSSVVSFQSYNSIGSARDRQFKSTSTIRSNSYKRNVSFRRQHNRNSGHATRRNGVTQSRSQYSLARDSSETVMRPRRANRMSSTPSLPTPPPPVRARRGATNTKDLPPLNIAKPRLSYQQWKDDARKVSLELGQICEEAFNRTPVSSVETGEGSRESSETPPTSVSTIEDHIDATNRILEDRPRGDSSTYAARELAETRKRLIEHSKNAAADGMPEYLSDVISHLDRLIATESYANGNSGSSSIARSRLTFLPPISEEGDINARTSARGATTPGHAKRNTIRLVSPDSPLTSDNTNPITVHKRANTLPTDFLSGTIFDDSIPEEPNLADSISRRYSRFHTTLDPIEEEGKSPRTSEIRNSGDIRKWSWFKHRSHREDDDGPPPTSPLKDDVPMRRATASGALQTGVTRPLTSPQALEGGNGGKSTGLPERGSRFMKLFGKKKQFQKPVHEIARGSELNTLRYSRAYSDTNVA